MAAPFIVFEGLDGAGTTTQARRLVEALAQAGRAAHYTREPSDGPVGTLIRQALGGRLTHPDHSRLAPETMALLFAADRMDHLAAEVDPVRAAGVAVVCDRYVLSSLAYQGQELDDAFVRAINARARAPDLTIFLKTSPETALARRAGRHLQADLYEALQTQRRVAAAYDAAIQERSSSHRVQVLDGERPVDGIAEDCLRLALSCA